MSEDADHEALLLARAKEGDSSAVGRLLDQHREQLTRMVQFRLDRRVRGRVNPSDVLQDAYMEAARRIGEYLQSPEVPFYVWLRALTNQRVSQLHRDHLGRQMRDAGREVSADQPSSPSAGSSALVQQLAGDLTSPSMAAQKQELRRCLEEVLDQMEPIDREILVMRHFEQLSNLECAQILNLSPTAASNRYVRALERLKARLSP